MDSREQTEQLRSFLADCDVPCPGCGYNLRGAGGARCPECGLELVLQVQPPEKSLAWFFWGLLVQAAVGGYFALLLIVLVVIRAPLDAILTLLACAAAVSIGVSCWIGYRRRMAGLSARTRAELVGLCIVVSIALFWMSLSVIL